MDLEQYQKIMHSIKNILNIDLKHYKDEQMRRRLDSWLARVGAANWEVYFERIKKDDSELRKFRDYLTINVTEFFRDQERWKDLQNSVLNELLSVKNELRVWSAGCSKGAEIFSLSIILHDLTPGKKHYLLATDLDKGALETAKNGGPFLAEEVRNISPVQKGIFFKPGGPPYFVSENLTKKIVFREQNLIQDKYEENFDLIICRNVVIYFTAETKEVLYKRFQQALRPGGYLFVGGTEIIPKPLEIGFKNSGFSFYKKM